MNLFRKIYDWLDVRIGARELVEKQLTGYLLPRNINAWYSMGSVLLFIFTLQIMTGILLLIYYVPDADKAFASVTAILNNVPYGWLIRLCHAVGSKLMVLILFMHMFSVLFMGSYKSPRELSWLSGFILFNLVLGISLTGYLLPWSQLSFWATTVATNSFGAIPYVGPYLLEFLRGGKLKSRPLFWHYPHYSNQGGEPGSAIREGDWKLIEFHQDSRRELYNLRDDIDAVYRELSARAPERLHPNANRVAPKPWGAREFAMLDATTVCVVFREWPRQERSSS